MPRNHAEVRAWCKALFFAACLYLSLSCSQQRTCVLSRTLSLAPWRSVLLLLSFQPHLLLSLSRVRSVSLDTCFRIEVAISFSLQLSSKKNSIDISFFLSLSLSFSCSLALSLLLTPLLSFALFLLFDAFLFNILAASLCLCINLSVSFSPITIEKHIFHITQSYCHALSRSLPVSPFISRSHLLFLSPTLYFSHALSETHSFPLSLSVSFYQTHAYFSLFLTIAPSFSNILILWLSLALLRSYSLFLSLRLSLSLSLSLSLTHSFFLSFISLSHEHTLPHLFPPLSLSLFENLFPRQVVFRQASRIHFPFPIFDFTRRLHTSISRCQEGLHYPLMAFGVSVCFSVIVLFVAQVAITARLSRTFAGFPPCGWLLVLCCCLHRGGFSV